MSQQPSIQEAETFEIFPVGYVRRENERTYLEDDMYRQVTQSDKAPYDAPVLGVFACRSPVRPNPIGLTTAKILGINRDKGEVEIANIDAFDGTPVLDLKAYIPVCDRVENVRVPEWASDWPEWLPEEGLGLEE
jgi:tRNA (Thr-GGU) A37 N-methylase